MQPYPRKLAVDWGTSSRINRTYNKEKEKKNITRINQKITNNEHNFNEI